jgi:hypothetical protein
MARFRGPVLGRIRNSKELLGISTPRPTPIVPKKTQLVLNPCSVPIAYVSAPVTPDERDHGNPQGSGIADQAFTHFLPMADFFYDASIPPGLALYDPRAPQLEN